MSSVQRHGRWSIVFAMGELNPLAAGLGKSYFEPTNPKVPSAKFRELSTPFLLPGLIPSGSARKTGLSDEDR